MTCSWWRTADTARTTRARPLRPWLLGIAFRVAAQWRRRHRLEVPVADPEAELPDDAHAPDEVVAPASQAGAGCTRRSRGSTSTSARWW